MQGAHLDGTVRLRVARPGTCQSLAVQAMVGVTQSGRTPEEAVRGQQVLFQGPLGAGEHDFAFSLPVPDGPLSYQGEELGLGWSLRVVADMDDGQATADHLFRLVATPGSGFEIVHYATTELQKSSRALTLLVTFTLFGGGSAVAAYFGLRNILDGSAGVWSWVLVAVALFLLVNLIAGVRMELQNPKPGFRGPWADLGTDEPEYVYIGPVGATPDQCLVGRYRLKRRQPGAEGIPPDAPDTFQFTLSIGPTVEPSSLECMLVVDEVVVEHVPTVGKSRTYDVKERHHTVTAERARLEPTGHPGVYEARLPVPAPGAAPYSWGGRKGVGIRWRVEVAAELPGAEPMSGVIRLETTPMPPG